jgi:hypothetical protein
MLAKRSRTSTFFTCPLVFLLNVCGGGRYYACFSLQWVGTYWSWELSGLFTDCLSALYHKGSSRKGGRGRGRGRLAWDEHEILYILAPCAETVDVNIGCSLASNFAQIMEQEYVRRSQSSILYLPHRDKKDPKSGKGKWSLLL